MLNKEETNQEQENALAHIEKEVKDASGDENFEIEVTEEVEEPKQETKAEESQQEEEPEYGEKVQKRIKKLVDQRRDAELQTAQANEQVAQLTARLERLEQGNTSRVENEFNQRYAQTKQALAKAVEEGDTQAQLNFTEQLADMRAAMRIAEMQRQQQAVGQNMMMPLDTMTDPRTLMGGLLGSPMGGTMGTRQI